MNKIETAIVTARYWDQETPLGLIRVGATPKGVAMLSWDLSNFNYNLMKAALISAGGENANYLQVDFKEEIVPHIAAQLSAYFEAKLRDFTTDIIDWDSITKPFQKKVLMETLKIPYGERTTYKEIAKAIGEPPRSRQVGRALAENPILVIIPCHRVIGSDGGYKGYAGGIERKKQLLNTEINRARSDDE
jgi:O-6-methylguanine DNA methyltransferase